MNISQENNNAKLITGTLVIAAIVIAAAMIYKPSNKPFIVQKIDPTQDIDDDAILGNPAAPVTMIVFGDYECPYCKKAADTAEAQVRKEYVDTGKVRLVFRDYPLDNLHDYARPAAQASECANAQGKFWQYHDALFTQQEKLADLDYTALAGELGIDTASFKLCLDNGTYANEVELDRQAGEALGIEGTPATFINGKLIPGAFPYASYKQAIEDALKKSALNPASTLLLKTRVDTYGIVDEQN